jgi:GTP-binding protein
VRGGSQSFSGFTFAVTAGVRHAAGMSGLIAIVGRPNVGKSALFNRIAGRRIAIVHDQPGVTRDRISVEAEWRGRAFTLVDTGGIGLLRGEKCPDVILEAAREQIRLAIAAADLILLVVNVQEGIVPLDREVAQRLKESGKPVLLVAHKADRPSHDALAVEFAELGFPEIFPVSAIHERGIDRLLAAAVPRLPPPARAAAGGGGAETGAESPLKLAVVGRPNVGKSSLINALVKSDRVIVSPVPGTTRDAVDIPFTVEHAGARQSYVLIDTAGIRKTRRIADSIEFYSVRRAEDSITRCDLALLVLDAEAGILEQDKKIADRILAARKACVLVVNKWDLFRPAVARAHAQPPLSPPGAGKRHDRSARLTSLAAFGAWVQRQLFFLDYAPVIFTSATAGFHLDRLLEAIRFVAAQLRQQIPTALLNRAVHDAVERRQPVSAGGHRLKFFYATQVSQTPPTFLLFVNRDELFSEPYQRYLAGELRRAFGYEGCPLVLIPRPRPKTVESIRRKDRRRT